MIGYFRLSTKKKNEIRVEQSEVGCELRKSEIQNRRLPLRLTR